MPRKLDTRTVKELQQSWNPNIITHMNNEDHVLFTDIMLRDIHLDSMDELGDDFYGNDAKRIKEECLRMHKIFKEQYEKAEEVLHSTAPEMIAPMTVALNPTLNKLQEETCYTDITKSKWGGLPNFHFLLNPLDYTETSSATNWETKAKENPITLEQFVEKKHPKCKISGQPMIFLGQMRLGAVCKPIWQATATLHESSNLKEYSRSPIGNGSLWANQLPTHERWLLFFYSDYWEQPKVHQQLCVIEYQKYCGMSNILGESKFDPPWTQDEYFEFIKDYYSSLELPDNFGDGIIIEDRTHSQEITQWDVSFPLDPHDSWNWEYNEVIDELEEAEELLCQYKREEFRLFGKPISQQDPQRFASIYTNGGNEFNLMHPIVSWNSKHNDYTFQAYADLAYGPAYDDHMQQNVYWGHIDGSCT